MSYTENNSVVLAARFRLAGRDNLLKTNKKQTMSLERPQLKGLLLVLALILIVVVIAAVVASRKEDLSTMPIPTSSSVKTGSKNPAASTEIPSDPTTSPQEPSFELPAGYSSEESNAKQAEAMEEQKRQQEASWKALEEQAKNQEALMKEAIEKTQQDE
jgi:cytoskeletal protein RodZ